ncbi:MAG: peptide chain release factor N(5)-glutamine methyltransferase [Pseudomonadota bacterium]
MDKVSDAIRAATDTLTPTSDTARLDAELLMAHALGVPRSDMLIRMMDQPAPDTFAAMIERRSASEPVAYITGSQEFYGREFAVEPGVLIPRADSEVLIEAALELRAQPQRVLDLGTGSGALLLTILCEQPAANGVGLDASPIAARVAGTNAARLVGEGDCQMIRGDWREDGWREGLGRFDLILCNPPYVETDAKLDPDVRDYEPASALFAGSDGLDDYRILIPQLRGLMAAEAIVLFEIGATQAEPVTKLAQEAGFGVEIRNDLANRPRCVILW